MRFPPILNSVILYFCDFSRLYFWQKLDLSVPSVYNLNVVPKNFHIVMNYLSNIQHRREPLHTNMHFRLTPPQAAKSTKFIYILESITNKTGYNSRTCLLKYTVPNTAKNLYQVSPAGNKSVSAFVARTFCLERLTTFGISQFYCMATRRFCK